MSATTTSVPTGDVAVGIQRDGEPLLAPGPDPARMVLAVDLPGHQGGVAHHSLDTVEHGPHSMQPTQRPMYVGFRFSAKAARPSRVSSLEELTAWQRASFSRACSMEACAESFKRVLFSDRASGGPAAKVRAQLVDEGVDLRRRDDPVDQPDGQGLLGGPHVAEEGDLLGPGQTDDPGQQPRGAHVEGEATAREDGGELGPVGADHEVAAERQ